MLWASTLVARTATLPPPEINSPLLTLRTNRDHGAELCIEIVFEEIASLPSSTERLAPTLTAVITRLPGISVSPMTLPRARTAPPSEMSTGDGAETPMSVTWGDVETEDW